MKKKILSLIIIELLSFSMLLISIPVVQAQFEWDSYHDYEEIVGGLQNLEGSGIARVETIGTTNYGIEIKAVKISDNPEVDEGDEPDILFVGLHHAREWISAEVPYYLAVNLVEEYDADPNVKALVDSSEVWIIPVTNPDGFWWTQNTPDRYWRKNTKPNGDGTYGVDLDRNYGWHWGEDLDPDGISDGSDVTSDESYWGPSPFSEAETTAIKNLLTDPQHNFQAALSYHSFSQLILYPWACTEEPADDSNIMGLLAQEMSDLIYNVHGKTYTSQQASELYLVSGDFADWVYATLEVPAFTIELRPEPSDPPSLSDFELPESQILETCEENWPAALYLIYWTVYSQGGFMDFENGVDSGPIRSTIPGMRFTTTMGYDWVYADIRTGDYNVYPYGTQRYECHGNFFAWLGPNQGEGRIDFVGATASFVSMLTSTEYGTYLDAYDSEGNLVDTDFAPKNTETRTMTEIGVEASNIAYVIIHDTGNYWLIDDLRVLDLLRETSAFQSPDSNGVFKTLETLDIDASSEYEFATDQMQLLKMLLNWEYGRLRIQVLRPDGSVFTEFESESPPIRIVVPAAEVGTWSIVVTPIDVPYDDYPIAIDVVSFPDPQPPKITVEIPSDDEALQDGVNIEALVSDLSSVDWVTFSVREPNGELGDIIDPMFESMPATYMGQDHWQLPFDTTQLPDGPYLLLAEAGDMFGNEGSVTVEFSIRNWASLELLPASERNKAGRTVPVKFSLNVVETVDPAEPFVRNEELTIIISKKGDSKTILQTSTYGDTARDYRINSEDELYITNFRTLTKPTTYLVEIYRKGILIGSFTFGTVK